MAQLIIVRHHESKWNKQGLWTGAQDIGLSEYGIEMSEKMGAFLDGIRIDRVFLSAQMRTAETFVNMMKGLGKSTAEIARMPTEKSAALDERDYGDYTGKNKWEIKKTLGENAFDDIRRGWNVPVPHGETLKMVSERAVPYFLKTIAPVVVEGKNALVVSSGNALRALVKYIERLSDTDIQSVEIPFGAVIFYDIDADGHMLHKETRQIESQVNA